MSNVFDGHHIDLYDCKFTGSFEVDPEYAEDMAYGDVVAFVVTGTLTNATVKNAAGGDTKRVNSFKIGFAKPLTIEEGEQVRQAMHWETLYGEQLVIIEQQEKTKPVLTVKSFKDVKPEPQMEEDEFPFSVEDASESVEDYNPPQTQSMKPKDSVLSSFLYGPGGV